MKCVLCKEDFDSNRKLAAHLESTHQLTPSSYFSEFSHAEKCCGKCKRSLPALKFLVDKTNNYGRRSQCIECMKPGGTNRECPICSRVFKWSAVVNHMKSEHGIAPLDGFNNYLKEKYCPNCETVKPLDDFAKLQDPEKAYFSWCNACNKERNLARAVSDSEFSAIHYLVIRLAFADKCFLCDLSHNESLEMYNEPLHIDHLLAHAKGGSLSVENSVLLCKKCNLSKGTKRLEELVNESDAAILGSLPMIHSWAKVELARALTRQIYRENALTNSS